MQSRLESLIEAILNCMIGFGISFLANAVVLPIVGLPVTISQNIIIGLALTVVSVARQYALRRFCQSHLARLKLRIVGFLSKRATTL